VHEKQIEVRWRDLDPANHVNNAVFLTYLEEVRDEWLDCTVGSGTLFDYLLARVEIDFRREIRPEDDVVVARCELKSIGNSSITTNEQIATVDGTLVAEASAVVVARDSATGQTRSLSPEERASLALGT
jgi:acyl-CoA thioester hydrolase